MGATEEEEEEEATEEALAVADVGLSIAFGLRGKLTRLAFADGGSSGGGGYGSSGGCTLLSQDPERVDF